MSSSSHPCGADDHSLREGVITLLLDYNEPWGEGSNETIMNRAAGLVACIAAGDAKQYAPGAEHMRILIVYRDDPPPHDAKRAFEKFKEEAHDRYGIGVAWQAARPGN